MTKLSAEEIAEEIRKTDELTTRQCTRPSGTLSSAEWDVTTGFLSVLHSKDMM